MDENLFAHDDIRSEKNESFDDCHGKTITESRNAVLLCLVFHAREEGGMNQNKSPMVATGINAFF